MNDISKTIGWAQKSWNYYTGCEHWSLGDVFCGVNVKCYAKRLAEGRLRGRFGYDKINPFKPTLHRDKLNEPRKIKKGVRIFVADMGDLFGNFVSNEWIQIAIDVARDCPQHTFLFLTKNPARYEDFIFPDNCQLGTTINGKRDIYGRSRGNDNVSFVSCEPLYEDIADELPMSYLDWIIVGAQTNPTKLPLRFWVDKIVFEADKMSIPVFLKDNLAPLFPEGLRQELPISKEV